MVDQRRTSKRHVNSDEQLSIRVKTQRHIPYLVFALLAGIYLLPFMRLLLPVAPEGTLLDGATRVVHGQVFGRDFFEVIGPGTFYWLAFFFKLFGVTFVAARICLFITSLATATALYHLTRRICTHSLVLPSLILAGTCFGMLWPTISHHVDSNCFALLSVACMAAWQDRRKTLWLVASGALAAITTCFLQPKGLLLLAALICWLWLQRRRKAPTFLPLALVAGSYLCVGCLVMAYFWHKSALWDVFYATVVWPSKNYSAANVVPYAHNLIRNYWDQWGFARDGFHGAVLLGAVLLGAVLILPFLLVAVLPVLLVFWGISHWKTAGKPEVALYWLCGAAMWLAELHRKDIAHLVFGSPLFIVLCVYYIGLYRNKIAHAVLQVLAISAACLAGFNFALALMAHPVATRVGNVAVFRSDPILALLNSQVRPGTEIFAYPYCPMYYFLSATKNPTRYSLLMYGYNTPAQFEDAVQVLEQRRVKYVVWDKDFQAQKASIIFPGSPPVAPGALIVEPYLASHYKILKEDGGVLLLERKGHGDED